MTIAALEQAGKADKILVKAGLSPEQLLQELEVFAKRQAQASAGKRMAKTKIRKILV